MAYGDGSKPLYRESDRIWVASFEAGYTATGGRRRKSVSAKTEAECKRRLRDAVRAYRLEGEISLDPKMNVRRWCDQWLAARKNDVRPLVHQDYRRIVAKWITPTIGHYRLSELSPEAVRKLARAVSAAGLSSGTAAGIHGLLLSILRDARREGYVVPEPVFLTRRPEKAESSRSSLSVVQAATILLNASTPNAWPALPADPTPRHADGGEIAGRNRTKVQREAVTAYRLAARRRTHAEATSPARWMVGLMQALRQGEALGLTWGDSINFKNHLIRVDRELVYLSGDYSIPSHMWHVELGGGFYFLRPKTASGIRTIPMIGAVETALLEWREICPESVHDLVFPRSDGSPQSAALDRLAWEGLQDAAGVAKADGSYYLIHEMRHTTVSLLRAAGVSPDLIIDIVGHASFASSKPYLHDLPENTQARDALERAAALLQLGQ